MATATQSARAKSAKRPAKSRRQKRSSAVEHSAEELIAFYREMLKIRRFEEKAGQMYGMGLIGGRCHVLFGQGNVVGGVVERKSGVVGESGVIRGGRMISKKKLTIGGVR